MATRNRPDPKEQALRRSGTLNPHPEKIADPLFSQSTFFDARDAVQVKYEMLRRVLVDGAPIATTVSSFGLSRPSFYQSQEAFRNGGLPRLRGGVLNKARRGELELPLPLGFCYDAQSRLILDPDKQVQQSLRVFFSTFRRTGSATATVRAFRDQGLKFPRRARSGPAKGEILWGELEHSRALWLLHNPRYAGTFVFGRTRQRKSAPQRFERLAREDWIALIHNAHAAYISWDEFENNQRRLQQNAQVYGEDRRRSPPREGPALLQGIVLCGRCGERMTVRYERQGGQRKPVYVCQREGIKTATPICQSMPGATIDVAIGQLLVNAVSPMALEVALKVQGELRMRGEQSDQLRAKHVERIRYEADLARHRYMQVDPDNRMVADELEAE